MPRNVLYLAENAISPIQGGGIVVYALLRGLPPQQIFGFYSYGNITPAPEYADRLHRLPARQGGSSDASSYFRPPLGVHHGFASLSHRLLSGGSTFAAHLKDRIFHVDAELAQQRIEAAKFVPEVIFLAGLSFRTLHLARRLAERYSIPVVMLNMDDWMSDQTARSHPLSGYMRRTIASEMQGIAPWVEVAISNSPHLADELTRRYGIAHQTVNNACYDLMGSQSFIPSQKNPEEPLVITFSGALNWQLQGETLVLFSYAVAELATKRSVELHILTPWEFAPIANQISIPGKVIYKGFCSKDDLVKHYLASDFLVATTTFDELNILLFKHSLATKVSDYLCAGRPIISVGHPQWAVHDYVDKHSAGLTIRRGYIDDIKKALSGVLDWSPEQRETVGRKNRQLWEAAHDITVMGKQARDALGLGPVPPEL